MATASPPRSSGVVAPPPAIYAAGFAIGLVLHRLWPAPIVPHEWSRIVGPLLVASGLVGLPALLAFRRYHTSPNPYRPSTTLVTGGPYRFTRNPMYVGFTLMYLGAALWLNARWPLLLLPVVLLVMQYGVIVREEQYLESVFGDEYVQYRGRVRRWI